MERWEKTRAARFELAEGRCECIDHECVHQGRCDRPVIQDMYLSHKPGGWAVRCAIPSEIGGTHALLNCRIICIECYNARIARGGVNECHEERIKESRKAGNTEVPAVPDADAE